MSENEEVVDLFQEEIPESVKNAPKHHYADVDRSNGHGVLKVRMVKKHVLWGDHLWNAGRWLATHFDEHPEEVRGKSIVELGAGAGLPSVVSALNGASCTVVTDYPDPELIENLAWNLDENVKGAAREKAHAVGYLWGSSVDELLDVNNGNKFDVVILCDLLFNHSEHTKLVTSCQNLLSPNGLIWCVFTHYLPDRAKKDLRFLELCEEAGMTVTRIGEHKFSHVLFENDRGDPDVRRTCHIYQIKL